MVWFGFSSLLRELARHEAPAVIWSQLIANTFHGFGIVLDGRDDRSHFGDATREPFADRYRRKRQRRETEQLGPANPVELSRAEQVGNEDGRSWSDWMTDTEAAFL